MDKFTCLFLLLVLFSTVSSYDDKTAVKELPEKLAKQLDYMLKNFFLNDLTTNCTHTLTPDVRFLLYNKVNSDNPITLDPSRPSQISGKKKLVLVIHGWLSSQKAWRIQQLKEEYLKRYDCNIVVVDWSQSAAQLYNVTFCDVPLVANSVADFLCTLTDQANIHLASVHVIGHSLGAQVAGLAGQFVVEKCNIKLGRITGLDPSGMLYQQLPTSQKLDKADAEFVDVIHADGDKFGYWLDIGSVDFHPSCGRLQPGCPSIREISNDTLVSQVFCSQDRSLEYMAESVNSKELLAVSCSLCPRICSSDIISEVYTVMGEECRSIPKPARNFLIPTASSPPYGLGWNPYPMKRNATEG